MENEEKIIEKLNFIISKIGKFPTCADLKKLNEHWVRHKISGKGINYYREKLGYEQIRYPINYWSNWDNVKDFIKTLIIDDKFPTCQTISNANCQVYNKIKEHGGINAVAIEMGYAPPTFYITTDGHHVNSSYEYIFDEWLYGLKISHEVNGYISTTEKFRYDFKIKNIYVEIWGYPKNSNSKIGKVYNEKRKNKENFYILNNIKYASIESSIFKKLPEEINKYFFDVLSNYINMDECKVETELIIENAFKHVGYWTEDKICESIKLFIDEYGYFPKIPECDKYDKGLGNAVSKHGGIYYFAKLLNYDIPKYRRTINYKWTEEKVVEEIKEYIEKYKKFLTYKHLIKIGRSDLVHAIHNKGGIYYFAKLLNYDIPKYRRTINYKWTEETVFIFVKNYIDQNNKFPPYKYFKKTNKIGVVRAMKRLGGVEHWKEKMKEFLK